MDTLPFNDDAAKTHFAPFIYEEPIKKMILSLKYSDNGLAARALAPYMSAVFMQLCPRTYDKFTLVPVPLCKSRMRERGYNQSELLAKAVAADTELPVLTNALQRIKKTAPSKGMTPQQRKENIKGAFAVVSPEAVIGKYICLVDDVYTTGATTQECMRVLKEAGAKQVKILTAATVA
jgi:ComF family protein